MASNVPLTIQTVVWNGAFSNNSYLVMGKNGYNPPGGVTLVNVYWALVVDRSNLNVVENFTFTDNQNVPTQLNPYLSNSNYMLILTTSRLQSNNLPAGNLYQFLMGMGAGSALLSLEQIYATLSCGTWGNMAYTLVSVLDGSGGIEFSDYNFNIVAYPIQLMPVTVGTTVLYTPVNLF
jgi:hypothetical protein